MGDVIEPPAWQKAIFVLTPLLVIVTLMDALWVAHEIFSTLNTPAEPHWALGVIIPVGAFLSLFFALFEVPLASLVGTYSTCSWLVNNRRTAFLYDWLRLSLPGPGRLLVVGAVVGSAVLLRLRLKGDRWSGGWQRLSCPY